jgi:hypothetical protein
MQFHCILRPQLFIVVPLRISTPMVRKNGPQQRRGFNHLVNMDYYSRGTKIRRVFQKKTTNAAGWGTSEILDLGTQFYTT